jgi:hypothetical protein
MCIEIRMVGRRANCAASDGRSGHSEESLVSPKSHDAVSGSPFLLLW